jgi:hypothetical protein
MAIVRIATAVKNSMLTPIRDAIDAGSGAGTIKIYTSPMATLPSDAISTQTLLGTLTFSDPSGATPTGGVFTASAITQDSSADATGTAAWARIADSTGATVMDVDITATGGGGAMQMNTTSVVIGGPLLISALTVTL